MVPPSIAVLADSRKHTPTTSAGVRARLKGSVCERPSASTPALVRSARPPVLLTRRRGDLRLTGIRSDVPRPAPALASLGGGWAPVGGSRCWVFPFCYHRRRGGFPPR